MGNKCWNCARLGKCLICKPCDRFVRFRAFVTAKEVATLCGISERTLYRKLERSVVETLHWVEVVRGFAFYRERRDSTRDMFVLETNNVENAVKLSTALLQEVGNVKSL